MQQIQKAAPSSNNDFNFKLFKVKCYQDSADAGKNFQSALIFRMYCTWRALAFADNENGDKKNGLIKKFA